MAGPPGKLAWQLYWPALFWGTLAFAALFHALGAWFRRRTGHPKLGPWLRKGEHE